MNKPTVKLNKVDVQNCYNSISAILSDYPLSGHKISELEATRNKLLAMGANK